MLRMSDLVSSALAMAVVVLCTDAAHAAKAKYKTVDLTESGTIVGIVTFEGESRRPEKLKIKSNDQICHRESLYKEDLVVSEDKKVKWAVASIKKIRAGKPFPKEKPDEPVTLDQTGCRFVPHVVIVPARQTLRILNSDAILHNVHPVAKKNQSFNKAMTPHMKQMDVSFKRGERVPVKCDVHDWMRAWIIVTEHPYFGITGDNGEFRLEDVPVGKHAIEVWHESLGKQKIQVVVEAGKETRIEIKFKKGKRVARR